MHSILTVNTAATSYDLTTVAAVKAELGITAITEDTPIQTWIKQASKAASSYCDRVFAKETVTETFRERGRVWHDTQHQHNTLVLTRNPVASISSLTEDTTALVEGTDFECDKATGILYRLDQGYSKLWRFSSVVVQYQGGFDPTAYPDDLSRAAISLVKLLRASATRDPALRSENILSGLYSYTLFGPTDMPEGLPSDVKALLDKYKNHSV